MAARSRCDEARTQGAWPWAALCSLVLCAPACARAAKPSAGSENRELAACAGLGSERVEVIIVGSAAAPALRDAICDWFERDAARVEFRVSSELPPPRVLVPASPQRLAVELRSERDVRLHVDVMPRSGAPERASWDIELPGGLDAAAVEVIAQALHSTLEAAHALNAPAAEQIAADPPASSGALPSPPPAPDAAGAGQPPASSAARASPASSRAAQTAPTPRRVGLGYQIHVRGDEPLTHGPFLNAELALGLRSVALGTFVRAGAFTSGSARFADLELALRGLAFGAGISAQAPLGPWSARLALGPSLELISRELTVLDPEGLQPIADQPSRPRAFLGAEGGTAFRSGPFGIGVAGSLRWQLSESYYDLRDQGRRTTVMRPWRWQPGASLDVSYSW